MCFNKTHYHPQIKNEKRQLDLFEREQIFILNKKSSYAKMAFIPRYTSVHSVYIKQATE